MSGLKRNDGRSMHIACRRGGGHLLGRRRGTATVEAAIVLPVFLLIVIAAFDLGMAVFHNNTLEAAAKWAAREASVHGAKAAPELSVWGPASFSGAAGGASEISRCVKARLFALDPNDVQVQAEWLDGDNRFNQRVRITLSYQQSFIVPGLLGYPPIRLTAISTMNVSH